MQIEDKIRYEKLQYDINREAAKYQHYHLVKLICEYLTGEEIPPPDQSRFSFRKNFWKINEISWGLTKKTS